MISLPVQPVYAGRQASGFTLNPIRFPLTTGRVHTARGVESPSRLRATLLFEGDDVHDVIANLPQCHSIVYAFKSYPESFVEPVLGCRLVRPNVQTPGEISGLPWLWSCFPEQPFQSPGQRTRKLERVTVRGLTLDTIILLTDGYVELREFLIGEKRSAGASCTAPYLTAHHKGAQGL